MKTTVEELLANGYKAYHFHDGLLYQKSVTSTLFNTPLKLYFINVHSYQEKFEATVRFYREGMNNGGFEVEVVEQLSLKETEDFLCYLYDIMDCIPDPHNN